MAWLAADLSGPTANSLRRPPPPPAPLSRLGDLLEAHVELEQYGQKTKGIEIIGHEQRFGAEPSADIKSRFYDNMGNTIDYVYELEGDTLTIWGGEKGSPAYYKGRFSDDGNTISGAWVYPDGGGYASTSTRVEGS